MRDCNLDPDLGNMLVVTVDIPSPEALVRVAGVEHLARLCPCNRVVLQRAYLVDRHNRTMDAVGDRKGPPMTAGSELLAKNDVFR